MPGFQLKAGQAAAAMVCMCAGNTFALVWESKQLIEISNALMKMLARSAGQNAVQLGLYATVSSALVYNCFVACMLLCHRCLLAATCIHKAPVHLHCSMCSSES